MARPPKVKTLYVKDYYLVNGCPSFSKSGSITGMRKKYYGNDALLVRCGSYIYLVDSNVYAKAH